MQATALTDAIAIRQFETLPDGVGVVTIDCSGGGTDAGFASFLQSPHALEYDGTVYGRSGWNSDTSSIYYRSDRKPAFWSIELSEVTLSF